MTKEEFAALPQEQKLQAKNFRGETVRWKRKEDGTVFVYAKGKSRRGRRYSENDFLANFEPLVKDENAAWHRRLRRVIRLIRENGLWEELLPLMENLDKMQYDDLIRFQTLYWTRPRQKEYASIAEYNEQVQKYFGFLYTRYPFLFAEEHDGIEPVWEYMPEITFVKTKSMYFGWGNTRYKEEIAEALLKKQSYRTPNLTVSYDVYFEYNAEKGKAWYSENGRGGGLEHNYLALSASTAIFCEND